MRIPLIHQAKDDSAKDFWGNLTKRLNAGDQMLKMASAPGAEKQLVKEGMVIQYRPPTGEYTVKLGHKSDVVVTGVAKQESDLRKQVRTALNYVAHMSPRLAKEMEEIEDEKRNQFVYKDMERCRDCVHFFSDTSHETYRDKCKTCTFATLGGGMDNFFPRSHHMIVYVPNWFDTNNVNTKADKKAFQGSLSLLDSHRTGSAHEPNPELIARNIVANSSKCSHDGHCKASCLGSMMMRTFSEQGLNFQKLGKAVVDCIEKQSGVQIAIAEGGSPKVGETYQSKEGYQPRKVIEVSKGIVKLQDQRGGTTDVPLTQWPPSFIQASKTGKVIIASTFGGGADASFIKKAIKDPDKAQEILDNGEEIEDYPIDWNPETGESESNGGKEFLVKYEGKQYFVQTNWDDEAFEYQEFSPSPRGNNEYVKQWEKRSVHQEASAACCEAPGAMSPAGRKALDKYEEAKDNYIESRQLKPQAPGKKITAEPAAAAQEPPVGGWKHDEGAQERRDRKSEDDLMREWKDKGITDQNIAEKLEKHKGSPGGPCITMEKWKRFNKTSAFAGTLCLAQVK